MTPRNLSDIGQGLYGSRWQSPLARALNVSDRTVRYWASGAHGIPETASREIADLVSRARAKRTLDLLADLQRDEGQGVEIVLMQGRGTAAQKATSLLADVLVALGIKGTILP